MWPFRKTKSKDQSSWKSPFDAEVIRPGDPGWAIFEAAMKSQSPVVGIYNGETGEIVSIEVLGDD